MSTTKLSPRQKMINMLYLVLTAILALNVSSEVLDAFKTVNDGIGDSNQSLKAKNTEMYLNLQAQFKNDSLKAKEVFAKSQNARAISSKLYTLLQNYKLQMIADAGGIDAETGKIKRDDDVGISTRLFVEKSNKGKALKNEIIKTRNDLLALLSNADRAAVEKTLLLKIEEQSGNVTWEFAKFNQVPVVAAVTLLSKYQNDLLSAESHVIETLYASIDKGRLKVDKMEAKILSPSNFIMQGEAYKADVMVAAYSSTQHPDVFLGSFNSLIKKNENGTYAMLVSASEVPPLTNASQVDVQQGFGKIQMQGASVGNKKYAGVVRVKADDKYQFYPFEGEYLVAPKMAVVSPKMMNVMYIGLDNPVDISVPGVAQNNISAILTGGSLLKSADGSYNARVSTVGLAKVTVKAKIEGREMVMGEQQFRVKRIPDPLTTLDGLHKGGKIRLSQLKNSRGVVAKIENFEYPANFKIVSFEFRHSSKKDANIVAIQNTGPAYSTKIKDKIEKQISAGDALFIDEIIVQGPAGDKRKINSIAFEVIQ